MKLIKYLTIGAAALCLSVAPGDAQSPGSSTDYYGPVVRSSVRVLAQHADGSADYGTGWVIAPADRDRAGAAVIVTARHVIEHAVKITIVESGSQISDQKEAALIASTVDQDVAFLEVKGITEPALQITRAVPNVGDNVAAAGYTTESDRNEAGGHAKSASIKRGGLSKAYNGPVSDEAQASIDKLEFDAPIQAGFSGGPLLNSCGRVIGMTIQDGGHLRLGDGQNVALAQGVSTAVASDEIIRAAKAKGIAVTAVDGACGDGPAVSDQKLIKPVAKCPASFMSVDDAGNPCTPIDPTPGQRFTHWLKSTPGMVISIAVILLVVVIGAILWFLLHGSADKPPVTDKHGIDPMNGRSEPLVTGHRPGAGTVDASAPRTLTLAGRGPEGETISLRFTADELRTKSVMLGVEGDPNGRIPDNRSKRWVGRRHAELGFNGAQFTIRDNRSLNKTKVGGKELEPLAEETLVSGDAILLADVRLNVTIG